MTDVVGSVSILGIRFVFVYFGLISLADADVVSVDVDDAAGIEHEDGSIDVSPSHSVYVQEILICD